MTELPVSTASERIYQLGPADSFQQRWAELVDVSPTRGHVLVDLVEEVVLYFVLAMFFGRIIERIFFPQGPASISVESTLKLFILVLVQFIVDIIVVFYIELIVRLVPLIYPQRRSSGAIISGHGAIIVIIVLIATQPSFIARTNELINRF